MDNWLKDRKQRVERRAWFLQKKQPQGFSLPPSCSGITLSQEFLVIQTGQDCVTSDSTEHDNCVLMVPAKACQSENFPEPK